MLLSWLLLFRLHGSYSVQSIDDLAYIVAFGLDKGDKSELKVTFEFTRPNTSGETPAEEASPTIINSVEANSIDSAINLMNTYVSKEINFSHCQAVVISEALSAEGLSKHLYTMMNKVQLRPDANIIISKCLAKDFIQNTQPNLENLIAKYYEIVPISSEYTGYTANTTIGDFFNRFVCTTYEPCAILRCYQHFYRVW